MIWTLFGCLACLAIGIIVGWVACRIKQHVTPAVPQPLPAIPQAKPTTVKPFDKKDRSTWPIVKAEAIPELRNEFDALRRDFPAEYSEDVRINGRSTTTRVRTLQTRLAYATELLDMHGLGAEFREGIEELEETG